MNIADIEDKNPLKFVDDPELREKLHKELEVQKELQGYRDCLKNAKSEEDKKKCQEKLL